MGDMELSDGRRAFPRDGGSAGTQAVLLSHQAVLAPCCPFKLALS